MRDREHDSGETRGLGGDRVEGRHAVKELLVAGTRKVREIIVAGDQEPAPILDDIIDLADEAGVEIRELPRGRFYQMAATDAPQGVVAFAAPLREYALEELVGAAPADGAADEPDHRYHSAGARHVEQRVPPAESDAAAADADPADGDPADGGPAGQAGDEAADVPAREAADNVIPLEVPTVASPAETGTSATPAPALLLVVDGVTDPGNLGAILRTAECAGVTGVVLPRHRAARITPTVTKRAAGAIEHLHFAPVSGIPTALARLAELGVWTVGLDVAAPETIWELPIAEAPLALVLGAEGRGLSRLVRQRCDVTARIPVSGRLDALNVAAATAVALFEVLRRRDST
jgi:predicted rRNA methylase